MKQETKQRLVKAMKGIGAVALLGLAFGSGGLYNYTTTEKVDVGLLNSTAYSEGFVDGEESVEVLDPIVINNTITVTETVFETDYSFAQMSCDRLLYDDLDDCMDEITAEDRALSLAFVALEDTREVFDLLEDESLIADEDEVEIVKVYKDFEDVTVVSSDFDDGTYEFDIKVRIKDTESKERSTVYFRVIVDGDEAEIDSVYT